MEVPGIGNRPRLDQFSFPGIAKFDTRDYVSGEGR